MSTEKVKASTEIKPVSKQASQTASPPAKLPPLFRRFDWLAMLVAFGVVWVVYFLTLAPELTLEDSGELCTGSFYAGIPHPPGYPFWAIYSWLWTVLLPVGNVAWRVEVGEATAAAFGCGLVALMVSRGSSMLMEGLEVLKDLSRKWENVICVVCGITAGLLMGFGNTMWSESVAINRISLFGMPWIMAVLVCLMRWIYAPKQWQYLFAAMFFFGLCATIHQTLIVAAMGIEGAVIYAHPRLGRTFLAGNSIVFLAGWLADATGVTDALQTAEMLRYIFFTVGVLSIMGYVVFAVMTKETPFEFVADAGMAGCFLFLVLAMGKGGPLSFLLSLACLGVWIYGVAKTYKLGIEWGVAVVCLVLWVCGVAFYLYEPISCMTNPPMEWAYPRTVEGFKHALSRGQYEKVNPTDIIHDPSRFMMQLGLLISGISEEFNWVLLFVAVIPFLFFMRLQRRERSWLTCLAGVYFCIGIILVILMNPSEDRASVDLHRVFFASSHGVIAILFGMGLALIAGYMATNYQKFRQWGLAGGCIAAVLGVYSLWASVGKHYFGLDGTVPVSEMPKWIAKAFAPHQYGLPIFGSLILVALPFIFLAALAIYRDRAPLAITLAVFAVMPISSALSHWGTSEQRNHWFGYWFGHDMFTPPFTDPKTQKLSNDNNLRAELLKNPTGTNNIYPEMAKNAILFGGTDPGRFCPTYMIFCESFIPHKDQPEQDQHFDRRDVYIITQNALADPTYLQYLRAQYNRSKQIDPPFFQEALRSERERKENYTTNGVARLAYKMLDEPLTKFGAKVEARRREEGVYPPKEIYIPTPEDSDRCFQEYMADASQRYQHDMQYPPDKFPNEPRLLKPMEEVHQTPDGRVSVSGQVAVMSINGLLTKVIFDHCPNNEFYVEESFPLDWMYPYLSPYGIIMKINRQPMDQMTQEMVDKDHLFWSKYSERTVGNWITYDTSLKEIGAWVAKVYLEHDYTDFKGNLRFIRDDQAQKAFSKLRSSQAGVYDWRFVHAKNGTDQQRMLKEADFAYRQAFAYCPYSPEVVSRYITLLLRLGRVDDALIVANTCAKLDPNSGFIQSTVKQLNEIKSRNGSAAMPATNIGEMENQWRSNPNDFHIAFNLASAYMQFQQLDKANEVFEQVLNNPKADEGVLYSLASYYAKMSNAPKLEQCLEKLSVLKPDSPEVWCDLAALRGALGRTNEAMQALQRSIEENSKRLAQNPKANDIADLIRKDPRFNPLRSLPEYQKIMASAK